MTAQTASGEFAGCLGGPNTATAERSRPSTPMQNATTIIMMAALIFLQPAQNATPSLARPRVYESMLPRVAICITGLMKDHLTRVLPGFRKHVIVATQYNADIFVDTWANAGVQRHQRLSSRRGSVDPMLDPS